MNDKELEVIFNFILNNMGNKEMMKLKELQQNAQNFYLRLVDLQAENAKLRECVEFYAANGLSKVSVGTKIDMKLMHEFYLSGGLARQVLKELEG